MTPKLYMPDRVPTLNEYRHGLRTIDLTPLQRSLLVEQYGFAEHRCFAMDLAARIGVSSWRVVNRHYALAAEKFCDAVDFLPHVDQKKGKPDWWSVWSVGFHHGGGRFSWQMHADCATALRELGWVGSADALLPEEVPAATPFVEGAMRRIIVNAYERDARARAACVAARGLRCVVCQFRFDERYGTIGDGYVHVHHVRPLGEACDAHIIDPAVDLAPVCANCHAMLHRRTPAYSIEELRSMLRCPTEG